jgi:hypothetical protein
MPPKEMSSLLMEVLWRNVTSPGLVTKGCYDNTEPLAFADGGQVVLRGSINDIIMMLELISRLERESRLQSVPLSERP